MLICLEWQPFVRGIFFGVLGIAVLAAAYPVFNRITKKQKEKIAPEILRLTEEIERENFSDK